MADKWTLLLTGPNHGLVGPFGDRFASHPDWYERVDVVRADQGAEPVAIIRSPDPFDESDDPGPWFSFQHWEALRRLPPKTPLYTQPTAKDAGFPEKFHVLDNHKAPKHYRAVAGDIGYINGWNDAIDAAQPTGGEWVRCSERLPTEADADYVWPLIDGRLIADPVPWQKISIIYNCTHWMPTGLKRPQPPREQEEPYE